MYAATQHSPARLNDVAATRPPGTIKLSRRTRRLAGATLLAASVLCSLLAQPLTAQAAPRTVWSPVQDTHANIIKPRSLGNQIATWYGPGFWGNRTGCGSTLKTNSWGIAHRTLPCGQLVWLRHKGKEIAVPVIDRGPFSGASVDLTARTKYYLNFQSGSVRMSVLRRRLPVRML